MTYAFASGSKPALPMQSESAEAPLKLWRQVRRPAIPVAVCFAVGIWMDRRFDPAWATWLTSGGLLMLAWSVCWFASRSRCACACLLLSCLCLGGARHNQYWSVAAADDISLYAAEEPQLVRLTGTIVGSPYIVARQDDNLRSAWPQYDRTICNVRCRHLVTQPLGSSGGEWESLSTSGLVRLEVSGHLLHVDVGDEIEMQGRLTLPSVPRNPGDFDYRSYLRRQGVRAIVRCDYPESVRRIGAAQGWRVQAWRGQIREEAESLFNRHLSPKTAPLASALLLGSRSNMSDETRLAFAESGTMHLLAISGLHVGILAGFLWGLCRLLNTSPMTTAALLLTAVMTYAFITDARPPVVRASILVALAVAGLPGYRQVWPGNLLAIAAVIILAWNPTDLFDVGAQLSFLAVMGILWYTSLQRDARQQAADPAAIIEDESPGWLWQQFARFRKYVWQCYLITGAIWLFTTPLVALHFNLVAPVGFLLNVVLIPLVGLVLAAGYCLLFFGLLLPILADVFGVGFDGGLQLLLFIVELASWFDLGHYYIPAPALWWIVGYYLLLGALVVCGRHLRPNWSLRLLGAWVVAGLAVALVAQKSDGLRCTFLAMGHGCAVLIETPNGGTLLYDAGSINDALRAQQTIQNALWQRGRTGLDGVIVSHADLDHFNAVPGLMRSMSVGRLFVARSFLDFDQQGVVQVCEAAAQRGVPIELIQRGDRLRLDETVTLTILHPPDAFTANTDNEHSVVLLIEYAGRRILLTGDLEGEGLLQFLRQPPLAVDVLLSPHHGSVKANPPELPAWTKPDWVVISGSRREGLAELREVYAGAAGVFLTGIDGAVTFEIRPTDGRLRTSAFRNEAFPGP
jgi:competence protein ComEC